MTYRYLDIFNDSRTPAPDLAEVRRQCYRWTSAAVDEYNVLIISAKINAISNPYLREYTASIMHDVVTEQMANEDYEYCFSQQTVEQIEYDLKRIIKKARNEQIAEESESYDQTLISHTDGQQKSRLDSLEEQVRYLHKELEDLKASIRQPQLKEIYNWPWYTEKATMEDKQFFESRLRTICTSVQRSRSKDTKSYLALKVKEGLILRPQELKQEHQILYKYFGYTPTYQAYQSA